MHFSFHFMNVFNIGRYAIILIHSYDKLIKVTKCSFNTPCQPLIKELGWTTIDQLITSETNIMVYKSLHELAPQYMCNLFTRASQRCLRNILTDLRVPKKSSKTGQKCFSFGGAKAWNGFSVEGKQASSLTYL